MFYYKNIHLYTYLSIKKKYKKLINIIFNTYLLYNWIANVTINIINDNI